ncbi:delta-type opioid receptor-like [Ruditapes philippinarum]|uniref:delta-type opioid receptor-like n=1 Tax=Ruditapes philippinarum TaxID=129788 RepID=UPI00295C271F|nr:delta-type opioid receptor-like [Ruditapes philippinarum]
MTFVVILVTIIILGSIGNIISILIWKYGKTSKTTNCKTYMWTLALNDLFILLMLGTEYAFFTSGYYLRNKHDWICKPVLFFGMFSPQVSAWITVMIAVERMLYVCVPLKMYKSNVKRRSIIAICCIILFSFALNVYVLSTASIIVSNENKTNCYLNINDVNKFDFKLLDAISYGIFTFLLPLILITSSNIITLVAICVWKRISQERTRQQRSIKNITRIVISISLLHCISTCPYAAFMYTLNIASTTLLQYQNLIYICYFLNSGLNCALYCLFEESFRNDLKESITRLLNVFGLK